MASINLFLDKSRRDDSNQHPCTLRLTHMRRQWMITLGIYATPKDYDKAVSSSGSINEKQKLLREQLMEKKNKGQAVLDSLDVITIDNFKSAFFSEIDVVRSKDMLDTKTEFNIRIHDLRLAGSIKCAEVYQNALRTLLDYHKTLPLQDIDKNYLSRYEAYMKTKGNSPSTISMYLRSLRAIFNKCIKDKRLSPKYYPFKDYPLYSGSKSKSVLYPDQVEVWLNYTPKTEAGVRCKSFWFFSFLANGMNPKDIFNLRWNNITKDKLSFTRHKTMNTRKEAEEITLFLHPMAMDVIKQYGNKQGKGYVFPLFKDGMTEQDKYETLKTWKRQTNRILGRMGKHLGFDELNMALARHSMATSLAMKNISINVISRMLGHSKIETTTHYIKSLPDESMRKINHGMLDFGRTSLKAV